MGIPPVKAATNGILVVIPGNFPFKGRFAFVSADWLEGQAFVDLAQVHGADQFILVFDADWDTMCQGN